MSDQDFILVDEEEKESTGADEVDKEEKKDHLAVKKEEEKETEKETSIPYGYEEGMTLSPVKAEKTVHFTSPPKPFNDVIFCERKEWIGIEERSSA